MLASPISNVAVVAAVGMYFFRFPLTQPAVLVTEPAAVIVKVFVLVATIPAVRDKTPSTIGLPDKLKPSESLRSKFPKVASEIEDEVALPLINIFPVPE